MRIILALLFGLLLHCAPASAFFLHGGSAGPTPPPSNWYDPAWGFRKVITIDHKKVSSFSGETYASFPVLVSEATDANLAAHALSTGFDILFTTSDGITKLNHEIELYVSGTGQIMAWVQVPGLSTTVDTTLYVYYGNPAASNQQNVAATWDSHYKGVYHLAASNTGATLTQYSGNPIIPAASAPWHIAQTYDPVVIVDPNDATKLIMFYTGQAIVEGHECIGRATASVSAPLVWTDYASNPIICLTDSYRVDSVLVAGGTISLYSSDDDAKNIVLFTSTDDGFTFTKDAASPVLSPSGTETWVSQGDVWSEAGTFTMIYSYRETSQTDLLGLRYATSTDGKTFTKGAGGLPNPNLLSRGPAGSADSGNFEDHHVMKFGSTYAMIYDCVNGTTFSTMTLQMCFATSSSLTSGWLRSGSYPAGQPSGISGQTDQWQTQCSFMFGVSGTYYMLSCNAEGQAPFTNIYQIGAATLSGPTGTPLDLMTQGVIDSTGNNSLVGINLTGATGPFGGGAAAFDGHYSRAGSISAASAATTNYTMQAWVKPSSLSQNGIFLATGFWGPERGSDPQSGEALGISNGSGSAPGSHLIIGEPNIVYQDTGYSFINTTSWHSINAVNVSGTTTAYVDNSAAPSPAVGAPHAAVGGFYIGQQSGPTPATPTGMYAGAIDEVRFSDIVRSAGWLTTEYTMESAPGSFYSVGPEVPY